MTDMSFNDLIFLLKGAAVTLQATFWAMLIGTVLGVILGIARSTLPRWIGFGVGAFLDIFRSVPLLIQLVLANSAKSILGLNISTFSVGCILLGIYAAAFCSEVVLSGIQAVPPQTRRAARSLGLTYRQDLTEIVFPLALRVAFPSWIGVALAVMKDTSVLLWIGITELLRSSQIIVTRIQEPMFVLFIAGAIYFAMSYPASRLSAQYQKKWQAYD